MSASLICQTRLLPFLGCLVFCWLAAAGSGYAQAPDSLAHATASVLPAATPPGAAASAQSMPTLPPQFQLDTAAITVREFPDSALNAYRSSEDYTYVDPSAAEKSWWEEFSEWLDRLFSGDRKRRTNNTTQPESDYTDVFILIAIAILVIVLVLVRFDIRALFYGRGAKAELPFTEEIEDIHLLDFETLISVALQKKDYRRIIRLRYLWTLKELTDRGLIAWQPQKTNYDYLYELRDARLRDALAQAIRIFEYAWYGRYAVNEARLAEAEQLFARIREMLSHAKPEAAKVP